VAVAHPRGSVAFPTFLISPAVSVLGRLRDLHQSRRRVKLTVHRAELLGPLVHIGGKTLSDTVDSYFITITNASHDRDIVVTHLWIATEPPVHVHDTGLPVRLKYSAPWETSIPVKDVPAEPEEVFWLARCQLSPDDKVIKSRPRENVPPFGTVPRG
jgi:hypothetical protein